MDAILERLDMQNGEWPGIEVFVSQEGRHVWGLLPEDLYQALIELNTLLLHEEDREQ